jgi:tRNA(Ile)-lysidine synthase TilS/MesJ
MKVRLLHNLRNLTYEDALDDRHKDWVIPAICPECQEQRHECECPSEPTLIARRIRQQCNSMTDQERKEALERALKRIYKPNPSLTSPDTSATIL